MSNERPRLQLSATQIIASALAAITATVGASYLGVAGTVIGAAVASVLTVVGNAVYSHSLQRVARMAPPVRSQPERAVAPRRGWATLAAACAGVFAGVLIVVTVVEVVAGRPLSDMVRGRTGSGTTVLGNVGDSTSSSTPATPSPTVTVTVTPHVVTRTPTVTVTGTPTTVTDTPTAHASPSSTSSDDTATPTSSPSAPTSSP